MSDQFRWEIPPPKESGKGVWRARLAPLMERVGNWAAVKDCATDHGAVVLASQLRRKGLIIPAGSWEFRSAGKTVYARYLGPDEPTA